MKIFILGIILASSTVFASSSTIECSAKFFQSSMQWKPQENALYVSTVFKDTSHTWVFDKNINVFQFVTERLANTQNSGFFYAVSRFEGRIFIVSGLIKDGNLSNWETIDTPTEGDWSSIQKGIIDCHKI